MVFYVIISTQTIHHNSVCGAGIVVIMAVAAVVRLEVLMVTKVVTVAATFPGNRQKSLDPKE